MNRRQEPEYWRSICVGQTISLAYGDSTEKLQVDTIWRIIEAGGSAEYILVNLDLDNQFVLVRIIGKRITVYALRIDPTFSMGDRQDMIDRDNFWIFEPPEDKDNYDLLNLRFTEALDPMDVEFVWRRNSVGEIEGPCEQLPSNGTENLLATLTQYHCDDNMCPTPDIVVLEIGDARSSRGGTIQILHGEKINPESVSIL